MNVASVVVVVVVAGRKDARLFDSKVVERFSLVVVDTSTIRELIGKQVCFDTFDYCNL